jgi:hypothetical protein
MIRPCDQCGGQRWGMPNPVESGEQVDCPRCEGMPWVFCVYLKGDGCHLTEAGDCWTHGFKEGLFKPDPDSVMRWCFTHGSPFHWSNAEESFGPRCDYSRIVQTPGSTHPDLGRCEVGWVPRPIERLEEAR